MVEFVDVSTVSGPGLIVWLTSSLIQLIFLVNLNYQVRKNSWEKRCVSYGKRLSGVFWSVLTQKVFSLESLLTTSMTRSLPMLSCAVGKMRKPIRIRLTSVFWAMSVDLELLQKDLFTPFYLEQEWINLLKFLNAHERRPNVLSVIFLNDTQGSGNSRKHRYLRMVSAAGSMDWMAVRWQYPRSLTDLGSIC